MNKDNEKYAILKLYLLWIVAQFYESSHFPKIIIAIDGPKKNSFPFQVFFLLSHCQIDGFYENWHETRKQNAGEQNIANTWLPDYDLYLESNLIKYPSRPETNHENETIKILFSLLLLLARLLLFAHIFWVPTCNASCLIAVTMATGHRRLLGYYVRSFALLFHTILFPFIFNVFICIIRIQCQRK